jgi:hypothetical protein
MGPVKPREERRTTFLRARIRTEHGWSDVTIANVSSRGLMLQSVRPLQRNCFVEVRHGTACIVGRIVWARGAKCGLRTQDAIDVAGLLSRAPAKRARAGEDRRAAPRRPHAARRPAAAEIAETSRRFARVFDWSVMVLAAGAAGAFMAQAAWAALDTPLARVESALSGAD